jgi:hydrogenase-4 component B
LPMGVHAVGVVMVGIVPGLALLLTNPVAALFGDGPHVQQAVHLLRLPTLLLGGTLAVTITTGWALGRRARRHVTWGCGYTAPNARMQYTGSSFSAQFGALFEGFLPQLRREQLPKGPFPTEASKIGTHYVDAVERRMFEVLGQGEEMITKASEHISEQPRYSFAAGLLTIVVVVALLIGVGR